MHLRIENAGRSSDVDITMDGDTAVAVVDGRRYELKVAHTNDGNLLLFDQERVYDCRVLRANFRKNRFEVHVGRSILEFDVIDPRTLQSSHSSGGLADGVAQIIAPMPGKVVRILIGEGENVNPGQGVLIVEAMKMQNELKAPKQGVVSAINVSEGVTVNAGDVLAVVE